MLSRDDVRIVIPGCFSVTDESQKKEKMKILVLPGDGIGPEITRQAVKILERLKVEDFDCEINSMPIGGAGYEFCKDPLPSKTLEKARDSDAIILGAVGGPQFDSLPRNLRPEQGLLRIRKELGLFANLRPAVVYDELINASSLKPELIANLDLMIIRELTGDIYFGEPRGQRHSELGEREGFDTMIYSESEVLRIANYAFEIASKRGKKICSVDKANVLDASILWREVVSEVGLGFPEVELTHMYVDNAAMQLIRNPRYFDVILTGNMFGDILSDQASMLTGSIGMLPSASVNNNGIGLYEPVHGSAPDIAGTDQANPLATILSLAMLLRFSGNREDLALRVEKGVQEVLRKGFRTVDLAGEASTVIGTEKMGDLILDAL